MGRIVVTEYISVDGVVEAPSGSEAFERVGWSDGFSRGEEGNQFKVDETMASDAQLLGRVTYEQFADSSPLLEGEFADYFNAMPKYVVSSTLRDLLVYPVIVGAGKQLFDSTSETKRLRLAETRTFGDGVHLLVYERAA